MPNPCVKFNRSHHTKSGCHSLAKTLASHPRQGCAVSVVDKLGVSEIRKLDFQQTSSRILLVLKTQCDSKSKNSLIFTLSPSDMSSLTLSQGLWFSCAVKASSLKPRVHQDVFWFQVTIHDILGVNVLQPLSDLYEDLVPTG